MLIKVTQKESWHGGAIEYLRALPHWLELPDATLVHGFFEPGTPVALQRPQVIIGTLGGEVYLRERYTQPWYELYDGDKPLIVGHHDYLRTGEPFVYRERVFGIDTGCCTGGRLTGLLLPEFRLLSVPSRANYWEQIRAQYRRAHPWPPAAEWDSGAVRLLGAIYGHVVERYSRIVAQLRSELGFDQLSDREQARVYAAYVGEGPLAGLLHLARAGKLSLPGLRLRFKQPEKAAEFAASLGLDADENI